MLAALLWWSTLWLLSVAALLYAWFSYSYTYWKKKGVRYVQPSFPFGTLRDSVLVRKTIGLVFQDVYRQLEGHRYGGMFFFYKPVLLVRDPELIRHIMVKDFSVFQDRGINFDEEEPLNHHLIVLTGQRWKRLRSKLTPTFTSGKLKMMFPAMQQCGRKMVEVLAASASTGEILEMREVSARFATDIIASVAFGIECDCQRDPDNEFRQWGRKVFTPTLKMKLAGTMYDTFPAIAKALRLKTEVGDVSPYFRKMVYDTVRYREQNNVSRNDFIQLMIELKNKGCVDGEKENDDWKFSIDDVAAQAFVFFLAGFETSSTTMSFALHELAFNPDVQRRLQEEIDATLKETGGDFSYDAVNGMQYLDKVVQETLRKHPPVPFLNRVNNRCYQLPGSDLVLDENSRVFMPVYALHHDPQFYPDPERFDPERFSEEAKASRHPYVYLPFGEGPRICIGMRLGLMQTKLGLAYLLSRFDVLPSDQTRARLEFDARHWLLMSNSGVQLRLAKRTNL